MTGGPARVVLVGVRGFGAVHAARIAGLQQQGRVELVACVDPVVVADPPVAHGVPLHPDLPAALAVAGPVDVVVVAAPLGEHFVLAETALRAGADVLLEKPPVASLDDFARLLATETATGRVVQVGFQSLGSDGLEAFAADAFEIGAVTHVGAVGAWSRPRAYWERSPWAGHRSLDGRAVVDGVATNPLAHAVATALALVRARTVDDVRAVDVDLYRANAIESDDTSVVRVHTTGGRTVTCALTLCAPVQREPVLHVHGPGGSADYRYTTDEVVVHGPDGPRTQVLGREDLLENLLAHRRTGEPLRVPLVSTGAFMRVLAAVADADDPVRIDPRAIRWVGEGPDRYPVVDDVEHWLERAASTGRTFRELGVPWAHAGRDRVLVRLRVEGHRVADYHDGAGTLPTSTPRPVLHPVSTLTGVRVSAQHPADHDWHTGVGLAVPDVDGTNLWGGGTYVHGQGYRLLDDHGRVDGEPPLVTDGGFRQRLAWRSRDGAVLLEEQRTVRWGPLDGRAWHLHLGTVLRAGRGATVGSPGSKGRPDGGYGGFFWRFPACADVDVLTADARGEQAVQGTVSPWVAWAADFTAAPGVSGPATVVLSSPSAADAGDPWFVRVRDYPGLGSALAWRDPVVLPPGGELARRFDVAVVDGRLSPAEAADVAAALVGVRA
ncbi:Predicted dehydrogenase [Friedmanniella luteola]|uniref:Predicted dehydrogenase n=1 Tax=Friedmanniella luteola TaxID=546871 RepID=A0A1H1TQ38_9ACTN|nr:DUF6807 family protein [Friedmanniella luteola]SDS61679.1 Predicted dehydrogenase [Friedmanniella luteola]